MKTKLKQWLPIALCCVPAIAIAAIVGIGIAIGGAAFGGSWGLGLIVLALLICPLHMGWMVWRMQKRVAAGESAGMAACCSSDQDSTADPDPSARLQALRTRREALERELIELQGRQDGEEWSPVRLAV